MIAYGKVTKTFDEDTMSKMDELCECGAPHTLKLSESGRRAYPTEFICANVNHPDKVKWKFTQLTADKTPIVYRKCDPLEPVVDLTWPTKEQEYE